MHLCRAIKEDRQAHGTGLARLKGSQAPKYQYILDDDSSGPFQAKGVWRAIELGTKEWHAIPPYYHAWNNRCHTLAGSETGEASWDLALRGQGRFTIQAWWAAAPDAGSWTKQAVYEVVSGGHVIASKVERLEQSDDHAQPVDLPPRLHI